MESFARSGVVAGSNEPACSKTRHAAARERSGARATKLKAQIGIRRRMFTKTTVSTSVAIDLPGIDRATLDISVDDDRLTVKRQRAPDRTPRIIGENVPGANFLRTFSVPASVDQKDIRADYKDGVLASSSSEARRSEKRNASRSKFRKLSEPPA